MRPIDVLRPLVFWVFRLVFPTKAVGMENLVRDRAVMIVSNHMSLFDPVMIEGFSPRIISFLGKKELTKNPLIKGLLCSWLEMIPIDRGNADIDAIKSVLKVLKNGGAIGVFPEGTRHRDGELGELHTGAAMLALKGKADIQIMAYANRLRAFRRNVLMVGPVIPISDYAGVKVTHEVMQELTDRIAEEIKTLRDEGRSLLKKC